MLKKLAAQTGAKALCLAGGVAFNCVANGKIFDTTPFEQVYVIPPRAMPGSRWAQPTSSGTNSSVNLARS